ncbi:hypothetical protein P5V15_012787 [Pogonomyrmex californicus]
MQWRMSHVLLSEIKKLSMLRTLESGRYLSFSLVGSVQISAVTAYNQAFVGKHSSCYSAQEAAIRHLRSANRKKTSWLRMPIDNCNLTNVKLYLNSECYPYDDMNLDFDKNR